MMALGFNDKEVAQIKVTSDLYFIFKDLMLTAEEIDKQEKLPVQILGEMRNALDHIMRVFTKKIENDGDPDYFSKVLGKAHGHIYRAGYDVLDWFSIILRDKIKEVLESFSPEALHKALPDYYSGVRVKIEDFCVEIAKFRFLKDVDGQNDEKLRVIGQYAKVAKEIHKMYTNEILARVGLVVEEQSRIDKEKRKSRLERLWLPILIGVIGAITTLLAAIIPLFI